MGRECLALLAVARTRALMSIPSTVGEVFLLLVSKVLFLYRHCGRL